jgi:hypothetical protein
VKSISAYDNVSFAANCLTHSSDARVALRSGQVVGAGQADCAIGRFQTSNCEGIKVHLMIGTHQQVHLSGISVRPPHLSRGRGAIAIGCTEGVSRVLCSGPRLVRAVVENNLVYTLSAISRFAQLAPVMTYITASGVEIDLYHLSTEGNGTMP